jgi:uncharacterized protein
LNNLFGGTKIVFTGPMGAGKTTAIGAISEIPPVKTDAFNNDRNAFDKDTTTVGFDFGELTLDDGEKLSLYGTPGQERFDYMWKILAKGALGVVLLLDHSQANQPQVMNLYLDVFDEQLRNSSIVIGIGRMDSNDHQSYMSYSQELTKRQLTIPLFTVDVREPDDVRLLITALISQLEVNV